MIHRSLNIVLLPVLLFAACEMESGDSSTTKKDLCVRLSNAFCERAGEVGCDIQVGTCKSDYRQDCEDMFADDCRATSDSIAQIDHEIKMIIEPKETCEALNSVTGYLSDSLTTLESAPCRSGGSSGENPSLGYLCEELVGEICEKVVDLACTSQSELACANTLLQGSVIRIGSHACANVTDSTEATDAQKSAFSEAFAEVKDATSCADFGF